MSDKLFTLGTFTVNIPKVDNANVNSNNNNVIESNGDFPIPSNKTGWNSFSVNVPSVNNADINSNNNNVIESNGNFPIPSGKTGWNSFSVNVSPNLYQYQTINKNGTYIIPPGYNGLNTITVNFNDQSDNTAIPVEPVPTETEPTDPENPETVVKVGTVDKEKTVNNTVWYYNRFVIKRSTYWSTFSAIYSSTGSQSRFVALYDHGHNNNFYGVGFHNPFNESINFNVLVAGEGMRWFFNLTLMPGASIDIQNDLYESNHSAVWIDKEPNETKLNILHERYNPVYLEYRDQYFINKAVLYSISPPTKTVQPNDEMMGNSFNLSEIDRTGIYLPNS